jgi:hypothetical protein
VADIPSYVQGAARWLVWWLTHDRADLATEANLNKRVGELPPGTFGEAMQVATQLIRNVQNILDMPSYAPLWAAQLPAGSAGLPQETREQYLERVGALAAEQGITTTGTVDVRIGLELPWISGRGGGRTFIITVPAGAPLSLVYRAANQQARQILEHGDSDMPAHQAALHEGEWIVQILSPLPYIGE